MAEFDSHRQYSEFRHYVMRKSRHVLDERNQRFIQTVIETSKKRHGNIPKDSILWRAQIGIEWESQPIRDAQGNEIDAVDVPAPLIEKKMVPFEDRASEGRVNPKGIPCLYLSDDRDTAMTEVRPWIGAFVSVAQFITLRDLNVVDCSMDGEGHTIYFFGEPSAEKREERVWSDINRAYSEPVTRSDDIAEYAPTQFLAEAFRSAGLDGVVYGSKLGKGKNIALFDLKAADQINCEAYRVESLNPTFSHVADAYFVTKYLERDSPLMAILGVEDKAKE